MSSIYLDYNATAPLKPQVSERMLEVMQEPSNPSSVHKFGRNAKKLLEDARASIAFSISAFPQEIVFTGSVTEANNWALSAFPGWRVLASAVEHSSVIHAAGEIIPVDENGVVRLDALQEMLAANAAPALVSIMLANNETGVIQPINAIAALCKSRGALLHCDAVQAIGRIPVDFSSLGCDLMSFSAHKCGGPVGGAALAVKTGLETQPFLQGGGQESRRRAGTENLPAIVGFAVACELAQDLRPVKALARWLERLENELSAASPSMRVLSGGVERLPNTLCLTMPGVGQEVQLMHFDLSGVAVSAGSACSSGRIEPSHVLRAMGLSDAEAGMAIRLSGGWATKEDDLKRFAECWKAASSRTMSKTPLAEVVA